MKKIIDLIKKVLGLAKTVTPEQKQEIQEIATNVIVALEEVKEKKVARKNVATSPAAIVGNEAPKKKKRYYKPKNKA